MTFEEYLTSLEGKRVAVIGIGISNQPLIELLLQRGIAVTARDKKDRTALAPWLVSWSPGAPCCAWVQTTWRI